MLFRRRTKKYAALDIGSNSIKLVIATLQNKIWNITCEEIETPDNAIDTDGNILDHPSLIEALIKLRNDRELEVSYCLRGDNIYWLIERVETIDDDDELDDAIRLIIEEKYQIDWKMNLYSYHKMNDDDGETQVLVSMASRTVIIDHLNIIQEAGFRVNTIEVLPLPMWRLIPDGMVMVHIGAKQVAIFYKKNDKPYYAFLNKKSGNLIGKWPDRDALYYEGLENESIKTNLAPAISSIVIQAVNHYRNQCKKLPVGVVLAGGGANLPGLDEYLENEIRDHINIDSLGGIRVSLFDERTLTEHNIASAGTIKPQYATAIGLVLRAFDKTGFNLYSGILKKQDFKPIRKKLTITITIIVVVGIIAACSLVNVINNLQTRFVDARYNNDVLRGIIAQKEEFQSIMDENLALIEQIESLKDGQKVSDILRITKDNMPGDLWVYEFKETDTGYSIRGGSVMLESVGIFFDSLNKEHDAKLSVVEETFYGGRVMYAWEGAILRESEQKAREDIQQDADEQAQNDDTQQETQRESQPDSLQETQYKEGED